MHDRSNQIVKFSWPCFQKWHFVHQVVSKFQFSLTWDWRECATDFKVLVASNEWFKKCFSIACWGNSVSPCYTFESSRASWALYEIFKLCVTKYSRENLSEKKIALNNSNMLQNPPKPFMQFNSRQTKQGLQRMPTAFQSSPRHAAGNGKQQPSMKEHQKSTRWF